MNVGPFMGDWLRLLAVLGLELGVIAAAFSFLQRTKASARWQRLSWRGALVTSLLVVGIELAGVGQWMAGWWHNEQPNPGQVTIVSSNLEPTPELSVLSTAALEANANVADGRPLHLAPTGSSGLDPLAPIWWPAWLWMAGTILLIGRMLLARLVFAVGLCRRRRLCDDRIVQRVSELAKRLGLRRRVRVFQMDDLPAPISYGVFVSGIVLPSEVAGHDGAGRDAMLLHELAHISARDGFWQAVGDLIVGCLWWHPAVWWTRREMNAASELAADEASAAMEDGPGILAECLVNLARRLTTPAGAGWQGIQGSHFRSRVGRRVERLLSFESGALPTESFRRRWAGRGVIAIVLGGLLLLGSFLSHRQEDFSSWRESWNASLGRMFLAQLAAAEPEPTTTESESATGGEPVAPIQWMPWSADAVAEARSHGRPVLVVFTADWAISSLVNEKMAIDIPTVRQRLHALSAATLKADWTTATNAAIATELQTFGKASVPLTLIYAADQGLAPEVLPDVLTPEVVLAALDRVASATERATRQIPAPSSTNGLSPGETLTRQVSTVLFEAKALYDAGLFSEAKAKFSEILRDDPKSEAARHYLTLIDNARTSAAAMPGPKAPLNLRLDSIRLESFGGTETLSVMVERLSREVRAADPSGHGVNFLINSPALAIEDISSIYVQVDPPRRGATLRQILNAMVKGTGDSIRYAVEGYAVVFTGVAPPSVAPPAALQTRWFKIDPTRVANTVRDRLGPTVAITPGTNSADALIITAGDALLYNLRRYFEDLGARFGPVKLGPGRVGSPGQMFYNDRLGMLMVRAPLEELDIIEKSIQSLNTPPPQISIEAKFCEVSGETLSALGFDWMLSRVGAREAPADDPSRRVAVDFGLPLEPEKAPQGPPVWVNTANVTGILTEQQAQIVFRALSQRRGVNILSTPKVTTLSTRQAQIKVVDVRSVVTHLDPGKKYSGVPLNPGKEASSREPVSGVAEFESGPVLDVVPYVSADGVTIQLTLIATVNEFVGYDLESARKFAAENPDRQEATVPVYRQRQIISTARVWDGQTVVLSGGEDKLDIVRSKKAGVAGDVPFIGKLFRTQHAEKEKTKLIVLVTVWIIDPAGNRVNHIDSTPPGVPPQPETRQK